MTAYQLENGVSEAAFRERLRDGATFLVVCTVGATRTPGSLPGGWRFYVENPSKSRWAALSLARLVRGQQVPREFKTLDGICGFMIGLGLPVALVPLNDGEGYEIRADGGIAYRPVVVLG